MLKAINRILPLKNILIRLQNDVIEAHAINSYSQSQALHFMFEPAACYKF